MAVFRVLLVGKELHLYLETKLAIHFRVQACENLQTAVSLASRYNDLAVVAVSAGSAEVQPGAIVNLRQCSPLLQIVLITNVNSVLKHIHEDHLVAVSLESIHEIVATIRQRADQFRREQDASLLDLLARR